MVVEGCWSFGLAGSLDGDEDEGLEPQSEESIASVVFVGFSGGLFLVSDLWMWMWMWFWFRFAVCLLFARCSPVGQIVKPSYQ